MNKNIIFTSQVLRTLRSLPYEERLNVASALAGEMLLGTGPCDNLSPDENIVYQMLRHNVNRASRCAASCL